nr:S24 family peptidase [Candidatus Hamiltonella defensa]
MKTYLFERIREQRKKLNMTQAHIAKLMNISRVSVTKWENGNAKPGGEHLQILAKVLACTPDWLLYGENIHNKPDDSRLYLLPSVNFRRLPVITWAQAGKWDGKSPIAEIEKIEGWIEIMSNASENAFMMRVNGDSMTNPQGIPTVPEGAIILVEPNYENIEDLNGKIVVLHLEGSKEPTVKKFLIDGPNIYLKSLNPAFKMIEIEGNFTIKGKVTKIIQEL